MDTQPFALPKPGSSADTLADRVLAHLRADGEPSESLRGIADAIGTSHRMLQYHFGTRERLLGAVLLKFRSQLVTSAPPEFRSRSQYVRYSWALYREPDNFLMMELLILITSPSAGALTDMSLMKQLSNPWSETIVALGIREGLTPERSAAEARLVRNAWRGMHQDLYGTGDGPGVDAALEVLLEWLDASSARSAVAR